MFLNLYDYKLHMNSFELTKSGEGYTYALKINSYLNNMLTFQIPIIANAVILNLIFILTTTFLKIKVYISL